MSKVKTIDIDPTLTRTEVKRGKNTFYLCFTFKALALAQKNLRSIGVECNLLHALDMTSMDAERLVPLLYAALLTHQPKITVDQVWELVTFRNLGLIFEGLAAAWQASLAEPSEEETKADPTEPDM